MKNKNYILMLAFFALLGFYVAKKTILKPKARSFKSALTDLDESTISKISIHPNGSTSPEILLNKKDNQWVVSDGTNTYPTEENQVEGMLKELSNLKTKQLISKSKDKWATYEVDDTKGKIVSLYSGDQLKSKLYIGKFGFNQTTRSGVSYARLADESDVYALNGFVSMSIPKDINTLRKKKMVSIKKDDMQTLDLNIENNHWSLQKDENNHWNGDIAVDSTKINAYLQKLSNLNGKTFSNLTQNPSSEKIAHLVVHSKDNASTTINIYRNPDSDKNFIAQSTDNEALFETDSTGIFKTIVTDWQNLNAQ